MSSSPGQLLLIALAGIAGLVFLVTRLQMPAFIAFFLVSMGVGLAAGLPAGAIAAHFTEGMGQVLGAISLIIGLGSVLGKLMAESGAAVATAAKLMEWFGRHRMAWAMAFAGFIIGLPTWFSVGFLLLLPVLQESCKAARIPIAHAGIPMVIGLGISHGLVPPHPGPMYAIAALKADTGKTILLALAVGVPSLLVAGLWIGTKLATRVVANAASDAGVAETPRAGAQLPGGVWMLGPALLPIFLMLAASGMTLALGEASGVSRAARFVGEPNAAMLIGVLLAMAAACWVSGFSKSRVLACAESSLAPVAAVLLVVGAGGGFSRLLMRSGVAEAITGLIQGWEVSPLLLGWLIAAALRIAVGSATVAITTASGLVAPLLAGQPGVDRELLVLAMGAGSSICSHVNDGGFWLVKEFLGLTPLQTLKTWTVLTTVFAVVALGVILLLDQVVGGK